MSKITKEELTLLQEQDQRKRAILNDMGLLQTQIHTLSHLFAQLNQEIEDNKKVLEDKYGQVNIELSDGSIKPVEDGKN
jgi:hypothetical protein